MATIVEMRSGQRYSASAVMETIACANCSILFGLPEKFKEERRKDHEYFYCPNGHSNYYPQQSDAEKLKRQLDATRDDLASTRTQLATARSSASALKGQVTKLKNRAKAGMCIHCRRTFTNYADHMRTEHGEEEQQEPKKGIYADGDKEGSRIGGGS